MSELPSNRPLVNYQKYIVHSVLDDRKCIVSESTNNGRKWWERTQIVDISSLESPVES